MATKKKMLEAAAGGAGGAGLDITDVFSTYLYEGTGSNQTITNGIDLSGEGGLVWVKGRTNSQSHGFFDTERGVSKALASDANWAEFTYQGVNAFYSSGFRVGYQNEYNQSALDYASWTFRKAPKFFDCLTWTGDGVAGREISHSLGAVPGVMIIKKTSATEQWAVYHRSEGNTKYGMLDQTDAFSTFSGAWNNTTPTDTVFTVGNWAKVNQSGATYVAYLFAHNNSDGEFGPDADQDIIKCGSFTGSSSGSLINLGFEPQFVMWKKTNSAGDWFIGDSMRGFTSKPPNNGQVVDLKANTGAAEGGLQYYLGLDPQGFWEDGLGTSNTYIYMAIRRGPLALAEDVAGTDLFSPAVTYNETSLEFNSGFVTDMMMYRNLGASIYNNEMKIGSRLTGVKAMRTDSSSAESTYSPIWDFMEGAGAPVNDAFGAWMWKRAPGFFDAVAYTGDGTTARSIPHNLGVAPEMMIHKRRNNTNDWFVPDFQNSQLLILNGNYSAFDTSILANYYGSGNGSSGGAGSLVTPDASTFTVTPNANVNGSGDTYIAYLFATLAGVSKVGSVTHSGTTNVDCGFSAGARLVILKRTDATGDWYVWDSVRGIIAGNDPYLLLNTAAAQVTNTDYIDPLSSGFTITSTFTAGDYIFYAIA